MNNRRAEVFNALPNDLTLRSRQNITHHSVHVRLLRQYVSGYHRHRFPFQGEPGALVFVRTSCRAWILWVLDSFAGMVDCANFCWQDHVPRRPDSPITTMGHGRTRTISQFDSQLHPRLERGRSRIRHLQYVSDRILLQPPILQTNNCWFRVAAIRLTAPCRRQILPKHTQVGRRRPRRARERRHHRAGR